MVLVSGELGAGKTTFDPRRLPGARGDRAGDLAHLHDRAPLRGPVPVSHLDLYRLDGLAGEDPGLLDDYLTPDAVAFVEWPGGGRAQLLATRRSLLRVELRHAGGDRREVVERGRRERRRSSASTPRRRTLRCAGRSGGREAGPRVLEPSERADGRPAHAAELLAAIEDGGRAGRRLGGIDADRRRGRARLVHRPADRGRDRARARAGPAACRWRRRRRRSTRWRAGSASAEGRGRARLAVVDARRGQVFAALDAGGRASWAPLVALPGELAERVAARWRSRRWPAGDGSIRFRAEIEAAGAEVLPDADPAHRLSARHICPLAGAAEPGRAGAGRADVSETTRRGALGLSEIAAQRSDVTDALRVRGSPTATCRRCSRSSGARSRRPGRWRCSCSSSPSRRGSASRPTATGGLVGYLVCSRYADVWHLMNVAVRARAAPPRSRQPRCWSACSRTAGADARYTLEVRTSNHGAIAMYERLRLPAAPAAAAATTTTTARTP